MEMLAPENTLAIVADETRRQIKRERKRMSFHNWYCRNREANIERASAWAKANPERRKAINAARYETKEGRARHNEKTKEWAWNNLEKYAEKSRLASMRCRLKKRGLTIEQYMSMLTEQDNKCAICRIDSPGSVDRRPAGRKPKLGWPSTARPIETSRLWHVDHDHKTGAVRGLLCVHCNIALGYAKDDPDLLIAMANYLNIRR